MIFKNMNISSSTDFKKNQFEKKDNAKISDPSIQSKEENKMPSVVFSLEKNIFWFKFGKLFLYILIFLLPLFFLPITMYAVDANKKFLAISLIIASLLCYLVNFYFTRKIVYSKSILISAVAFFVVAGGISAFFSISPNISFFGDFTQADVFIDLVVYGLALYLAAVFFKKEDFNKIGIVFLASLIALSILGLFQLLGVYIFPFDFTKQAGFNVFGSAINFGIFIAFGLVLIVAVLSELKVSSKTKIILVFAGLLIVSDLILINYQLIWVVLAAMMAIYVIYNFIYRTEKGAFSAVGSTIPLFLAIIAFLLTLSGSSLLKNSNMPELPVDIKPNFLETLDISKKALSGSRIFTGTGLGTFYSQYNLNRSAYSAEFNQPIVWRLKFNQGFSFVSTYLVSAGIIGILSILFIVFAFSRVALKNTEDKKIAVISIGVLFIFLEWIVFPAYFASLVFSFIILGILAAFDSGSQEFDFSRATKSRAAIGVVLIVIFAAGAIFLLYFSCKKYIAAFYFQKGLIEFNSGNIIKTSENITEALSLDQNNEQYLRLASQILLTDAKNSRDPSIELSKDSKYQIKIADSVDFARRATAVNPIDFENWYNLGNVYEKIINIADKADYFAEETYSKAAELNPKNPDLLIGQAMVLMFSFRQTKDEVIKEAKINQAIAVLEKAISMKSDYAISHFQLGLAYALANRKDEAISQLELAKALVVSDVSVNFQLGILYYNKNDFDKAKTEMENAIRLNPVFSNAKYVLGLIYDKKGDKDNAISQFESVLKMNPSSVEVKNILNNLKTKGSAFAGNQPVSSESIDKSLGASAN